MSGIRDITDIHQYIEEARCLRNSMIILAAKDTLGYELDSSVAAELRTLGIRKDLSNKHWRGYLYICNEADQVAEVMGECDQSVAYSGEIDGHAIRVKSAPWNDGNAAEIMIDGKDYAVNQRGINIVIFDKKQDSVMDTVCFDTHSKDFACTREADINIRNRWSLKNILPDKIEVRIFFEGEVHLWNAYRSLVEAFRLDRRFHACVVIINPPNYGTAEDKIALVENDGCEIISFSASDLENADILISAPVDQMGSWMKNHKMAIAIPLSLVKICADTRQHFESFLRAGVDIDYYIFDRLMYEEIAGSGIVNEKLVKLGNPKFDGIYNALNKPRTLPEQWSKLKGKRIYLWTTDHVYKSGNVTFDLYAKQIFHYFEENQECALIFRPHPIYFQELMRDHVWTKEDIAAFRQYFKASANMVWDEYPDYSLSYSLADAILLDVNCGILVSALTIRKPMCILRRFDGRACEIYHPDLAARLYMAQDTDECMDFLNMVRDGKDVKKEMREEAFAKYIGDFDGRNGQRIKDFIAEKYFEKYGG